MGEIGGLLLYEPQLCKLFFLPEIQINAILLYGIWRS